MEFRVNDGEVCALGQLICVLAAPRALAEIKVRPLGEGIGFS